MNGFETFKWLQTIFTSHPKKSCMATSKLSFGHRAHDAFMYHLCIHMQCNRQTISQSDRQTKMDHHQWPPFKSNLKDLNVVQLVQLCDGDLCHWQTSITNWTMVTLGTQNLPSIAVRCHAVLWNNVMFREI